MNAKHLVACKTSSVRREEKIQLQYYLDPQPLGETEPCCVIEIYQLGETSDYGASCKVAMGEPEARRLVETLAHYRVMPLHLEDMVRDYLVDKEEAPAGR